jgi:hypothetical protein
MPWEFNKYLIFKSVNFFDSVPISNVKNSENFTAKEVSKGHQVCHVTIQKIIIKFAKNWITQ